MRGSAHFLIYSLINARKYFKIGLKETEITYRVHDLVLKDLSEALELSIKQSNLVYFVDFLQILVMDQYLTQGLTEEVRPFLDYLKSSPILRGWNKIICSLILVNSVKILKLSQEYYQAAMDLWNQKRITNVSELEDLCILQSQMNQEPIRFNFPQNYQYLRCAVGFLQPKCEINDKCEIQLIVYNSKDSIKFHPESIGIFFDNEQVDPLTILCGSEDVFMPGNVKLFRSVFTPFQMVNGKLKISYVTMQMKEPFLAVQFDDSSFVHMQNSHRFKCDSIEFMRKCQKMLRSKLSLQIEPIKPKLSVVFTTKESSFLVGSDIDVSVQIENLRAHSTSLSFNHRGENFYITLEPHSKKSLQMKFVAEFSKNWKISLKVLRFDY